MRCFMSLKISLIESHSVLTMALSCIITERKRDIGRKIFHTSLHLTPLLGGGWGPDRNFATLFGMEKLEWCRYPTEKSFWGYIEPFRHNTGV